MDAVDTDGASDVFDGLLTHIVEFETELVLHLVVYNTRNHNAARIGKRFQPRRHVNAVAVNVVTIDDDIANINADAELDASLSRYVGRLRSIIARWMSTAKPYGVHHTNKFDKHAVPGGLHDATAMFGDLGIDQFLPMRLELAQRAFVVIAYQPAIASDIGG